MSRRWQVIADGALVLGTLATLLAVAWAAGYRLGVDG